MGIKVSDESVIIRKFINKTELFFSEMKEVKCVIDHKKLTYEFEFITKYGDHYVCKKSNLLKGIGIHSRTLIAAEKYGFILNNISINDMDHIQVNKTEAKEYIDGVLATLEEIADETLRAKYGNKFVVKNSKYEDDYHIGIFVDIYKDGEKIVIDPEYAKYDIDTNEEGKPEYHVLTELLAEPSYINPATGEYSYMLDKEYYGKENIVEYFKEDYLGMCENIDNGSFESISEYNKNNNVNVI